MVEALDIRVKGIVQGVGFRPFVYRMAKKYLVNGWVLNAVDGVSIHAEGEGGLLDEFVIELSENAPAAAQVKEVDLKEVPLEGFDSFEIRFSDQAAAQRTTLVSPDLATCDDCVRELFNPNDRRFHYPFINCTNCGPRFTIIEKLPYDRAGTSMAPFRMCARCEGEYGDALDRRFHAQPDACFDCGPQISWCERVPLGGASVGGASSDGAPAGEGLSAVQWGSTRQESDAIFARAVQLLLEGKIVAVKGLGGFHLVCDASNAQALAELRGRKRRRGKAFAVMMPDVQAARRVCRVGEVEASLLESAQRPIVLLRKRVEARFAPGLADRLPELGVMLPCTPVQHLLLRGFREAGGGDMLVMTSGNIHDEPIVTDDGEAYRKLAGVADAFLGNNRAIRARYDDSVVRVVKAGADAEAVQFIRRARGYAPQPLSLTFPPAGEPSAAASDAAMPDAAAPSGDASSASPGDSASPSAAAGAGNWAARPTDEPLFAAGPEQKNAFTLMRAVERTAESPVGAVEAFVSQHIGDMENAETFDAWLEAKARYEELFDIHPARAACDAHPEYLSSKWAHDQQLPMVEVQHHHAHIASILGEHGLEGPVCGIAFDGTGYGMDGAIWGGEALLVNRRAFERFANLAYVPMPGGAAAVRQPLRMAYGALWAFDLLEHSAAAEALDALGQQAEVCDQMIERGLNAPMTSSAGRLFDAASALLGICTDPTYEGEPAILLEAAVWEGMAEGRARADAAASDDAAARYAIAITKNTATKNSTAQDTSVLLLDAAPTFKALLDDKLAGVPAPVIARRFHDAFVQAIVMIAELARGLYGISDIALGGGVFMNRYLLERSLAALAAAGFTVAVNRDLPPNDGCVSFGQAVVAWAANDERA